MNDCKCTQEERIEALEKMEEKTYQKVTTIEGALLGDKFHKIGMLEKQDQQDQKIDKIEKLLQGVKYWIIGAGAVISAGIIIATLIARFK